MVRFFRLLELVSGGVDLSALQVQSLGFFRGDGPCTPARRCSRSSWISFRGRHTVTLLPDSGPVGSSVMRRQPWSCRPVPALVFGIPRSNSSQEKAMTNNITCDGDMNIDLRGGGAARYSCRPETRRRHAAGGKRWLCCINQALLH